MHKAYISTCFTITDDTSVSNIHHTLNLKDIATYNHITYYKDEHAYNCA